MYERVETGKDFLVYLCDENITDMVLGFQVQTGSSSDKIASYASLMTQHFSISPSFTEITLQFYHTPENADRTANILYARMVDIITSLTQDTAEIQISKWLKQFLSYIETNYPKKNIPAISSMILRTLGNRYGKDVKLLSRMVSLNNLNFNGEIDVITDDAIKHVTSLFYALILKYYNALLPEMASFLDSDSIVTDDEYKHWFFVSIYSNLNMYITSTKYRKKYNKDPTKIIANTDKSDFEKYIGITPYGYYSYLVENTAQSINKTKVFFSMGQFDDDTALIYSTSYDNIIDLLISDHTVEPFEFEEYIDTIKDPSEKFLEKFTNDIYRLCLFLELIPIAPTTVESLPDIKQHIQLTIGNVDSMSTVYSNSGITNEVINQLYNQTFAKDLPEKTIINVFRTSKKFIEKINNSESITARTLLSASLGDVTPGKTYKNVSLDGGSQLCCLFENNIIPNSKITVQESNVNEDIDDQEKVPVEGLAEDNEKTLDLSDLIQKEPKPPVTDAAFIANIKKINTFYGDDMEVDDNGNIRGILSFVESINEKKAIYGYTKSTKSVRSKSYDRYTGISINSDNEIDWYVGPWKDKFSVEFDDKYKVPHNVSVPDTEEDLPEIVNTDKEFIMAAQKFNTLYGDKIKITSTGDLTYEDGTIIWKFLESRNETEAVYMIDIPRLGSHYIGLAIFSGELRYIKYDRYYFFIKPEWVEFISANMVLAYDHIRTKTLLYTYGTEDSMASGASLVVRIYVDPISGKTATNLTSNDGPDGYNVLANLELFGTSTSVDGIRLNNMDIADGFATKPVHNAVIRVGMDANNPTARLKQRSKEGGEPEPDDKPVIYDLYKFCFDTEQLLNKDTPLIPESELSKIIQDAKLTIFAVKNGGNFKVHSIVYKKEKEIEKPTEVTDD